MAIHYTQASAGSGKTTSIESAVTARLLKAELMPEQLMAVTFTRTAATELKERISQSLLRQGNAALAAGILSARVGTVHSVFGQLLSDFAFELGLSPEQRVLDEQDTQQVLAEAVDRSLSTTQVEQLSALGERLCVSDWREELLSIIALTRANNLDADALADCAQQSIESLRTLLPVANPAVTEVAFRELLNTAITEARRLASPTKGALKALKNCETLLRQRTLLWKNWLTVSKLKPTRMGEPIFSPAMEMGRAVLQCQQFQQDVTAFIAQLMDGAAQVMQTFAQIKQTRGLVDFIDQEQLALTALQHPAVRERLQEEISWLIVDEFQDTNPIQLALFASMSQLVDDVLLVGDAKQAIYGFRGSDPQLALAVLHHVEHGGGTTSTLPNSWRSRPGLVALSNTLFTEPFAHLLKPEQVQLRARRDDTLRSPELGWWTLACEGRPTKDQLLAALATGIREHIESTSEVLDRDSKTARPATWRDVAVLCRSNAEAATLAESCADEGIPVSLERAGLLETPEVSLALACLRRLIDPADALASAEILTLATGNGPECWLHERIDAVANHSDRAWNDNAHATLEKLAALRQHSGLLSPREALELALGAADVAGIVTRWAESRRLTEHRLANLAQLASLIDDYEGHCRAQFLAATAAGFILWLKQREQDFDDKQAANPGDAITITTYHSAKGLEWPIVICHSLDHPLKVSLFGPSVIESDSRFDWDDPLRGRSLRYWPNPFPESRSNDPLTAALQQAPEWRAAEQQARNEALQLLYVGVTRARDQLILPTTVEPDKVGDWLSLLGSNLLPPEGDSLPLDDQNHVRVAHRTCVGAGQPAPQHQSRTRHWLPERAAPSAQAPAYFQPASGVPPLDEGACTIEHDFRSRIDINGQVDMERLGTALHHCLALALSQPEIDPTIIQSILTEGVPGAVAAEQVVQRSQMLRDWIATRYPEATLHSELPFTQQLADGSLRQGAIDLAVETAAGWIVIDHKSHPAPAAQWKTIARQHSGQLNAYRDALESLTGARVRQTLIHFSVGGGLVHVVNDSRLNP